MSATPDGRPQIVEKNTMLDARQERERDYHADFAKRNADKAPQLVPLDRAKTALERLLDSLRLADDRDSFW